MNERTKWCPHCQAERPLTEFYTNKAAASGVDGYCKTYRKERQRARSQDASARRKQERREGGLPERAPRTPHRIDSDGRECATCGKYKSWSAFHRDSTSKTGHQVRCKDCSAARQQTPEGRAASRQRTADYRARMRGPDWKPAHVTRHVELECDGFQHLCTGCGLMRPVGEFPRNRETPCGYDPRCLDCRHSDRVERRQNNHNDIRTKENLHWAIRKYGITVDDFAWLLDQQGGVCAICHESEPESEKPRGRTRLSVDHDHDHCGPLRACKDCIRGLLCHECSVALGKFERKAVARALFEEYLNRRPFRAKR